MARHLKGFQEDEYHPLIATWMLRMMLGSSVAFRSFFDEDDGFQDCDVSGFLGFSHVDERRLKTKKLKKDLRERLAHFQVVAQKS